MVTAGLKWAPEMWPSAVTARANPRPCAKPTSKRIVSGADFVVTRMVPNPMKKKKKVPTNSATIFHQSCRVMPFPIYPPMVGLSVECAQGDLPEVWRLEGGNAGEEEREKPKQQGAQRRTS